ncbi:hypothetical protein Q7P37_001170 [Cladosporium fusiforme]
MQLLASECAGGIFAAAVRHLILCDSQRSLAREILRSWVETMRPGQGTCWSARAKTGGSGDDASKSDNAASIALHTSSLTDFSTPTKHPGLCVVVLSHQVDLPFFHWWISSGIIAAHPVKNIHNLTHARSQLAYRVKHSKAQQQRLLADQLNSLQSCARHSGRRLIKHCHFARNDPKHQCFGAWSVKREWISANQVCQACGQQNMARRTEQAGRLQV